MNLPRPAVPRSTAKSSAAGASADAYHFTAPHPEGKGAMKSMRDAIKDAASNPKILIM